MTAEEKLNSEGEVIGLLRKEKSHLHDNATTDHSKIERKETKARRAISGVVAFYAYMRHTEVNPGPHHTLIFDVPVTNVGGGYNHYSGTFTVPSAGVYVFSWTIACSNGGYIYSEIVVNADDIGGILTNCDTSKGRLSTTGLVVKEMNAGDVHVRTAPPPGPVGDIESLTPHERTSFSGWKLV
ncbi:uncharacterized protein LOC133172443 [Saccostrea echinata]|uniref:uncharacterized protein LOC133172443 n=1 Tax=Saccostrea echinata TaxID=191078 RepID=UPI002A82EA10|nr:uncharacterized protein LOC133172443 [Saccostrea echinata]